MQQLRGHDGPRGYNHSAGVNSNSQLSAIFELFIFLEVLKLGYKKLAKLCPRNSKFVSRLGKMSLGWVKIFHRPGEMPLAWVKLKIFL